MMMGCGLSARHLAIDLVLLVLARQVVTVDEQKFRAEQAHAFRAVGNHGFNVVLVSMLAERWMALPSSVTAGWSRISRSFSLQRGLDFRQLGHRRTTSGRSG